MIALNSVSLIVERAAPDLSSLRTVFLALHLAGGLVGLPILIVTLLLSSYVPRQPDLINFCITWVIYSISCTLLSFSKDTQNPPHTLCFIQSAMLQGATPMCAVATFLLIFKIWRTFRDPYSRPVIWVQFITLSLPYLVFILLLCISVGYQLAAPSSLTAKNGVYCTAAGIPFRKYIIPVFSIFIVGLMVGFEIAISVYYYRSRKLITTNFPLAHTNTSLSLIIRLTVFNVYLLITLGASANFLIGHAHSWAYIIQAPLPLLAFVLLATQKNILLTWCFWLRKKKSIPNHSDDNIPKSRSRPSESEFDLAYPPVDSRDVASLQTV